MATRIEEEGYARVMVVGTSALGVLIATTLTSRGYRTTLFGRDAVLLDCLVSRGARVVGDLPAAAAALDATERLAAPTTAFDLIIVATGPANAVATARASASWLAEDGVLIGLGAGLNDAAIAQIVGRHRYLGAVATFSASTEDLGVVERCAEGSLLVGCPEPIDAPGWIVSEVETAEPSVPPAPQDDEDDRVESGAEHEARPDDGESARKLPDEPATDEPEGPHHVGAVGEPPGERAVHAEIPSRARAAEDEAKAPAAAEGAEAADAPAPPPIHPSDARIAWVLRALEALAPVRVTDNLLGARWAELTLQCAFEPLAALSGLRAGELARDGLARRLFLRVVDELEGLGAHLEITPEPLLAIVGQGDDANARSDDSAPDEAAERRARHELVHNVAGRHARAFGALAERMRAGREVTTDSLRQATLDRADGLGVELPTLASVLDAVERAALSGSPVGLERVLRRAI